MKGIIGVGNIFKRDDGIGIRLLEEIEEGKDLGDIATYEVGSATMDVLHILKDLDEVLIIDAVNFRGDPGDHRFFTPEEVESLSGTETAHGTDILRVIEMSEGLDEIPQKIMIMGIQPRDTEFSEELSEPLKDKFPELVEALCEKVESYFSD